MLTLPNLENPTPADLRRAREWLGLSQPELSDELGFKEGGAGVIRAWEKGERFGKSFSPTPLALNALRFMVLVIAAHRLMPEYQAQYFHQFQQQCR